MDSEKNFNFTALLRMQTYENKHKVKPTHFTSIAGGIQKRLETNIKEKRRTRFTNFDNFRNLPECKSPVREPLNKTEQRRLQLLKWKEAKEKKKAEALAHKKKPFVVGVAKTMTFEPPPPISWPLPSTSGRVTRSQAARVNITNKKEKPKVYTFAPQNAVFNPTLKDLEMPTLSTFEQRRFDPHNQSSNVKNANDASKQEPRNLRSRTKLNEVTEIKQNQNHSKAQKKLVPKKKLAKQPLPSKTKSKLISSSTASSSSDGDTYSKETVAFKFTTPQKTPRKGRKSDNTTKKGNSSNIASKNNEKLVDISGSTSMDTDIDEKPSHTPEISIPKATPKKQNGTIQDFITFTPKNPVPKSESSSEEKLRSPKALVDVPMTPEVTEEVEQISPRVCLSRGKDNTRKEMKKKIDEGLLDEDNVCDMSVEYFQRQLDSEIKRMTEMCEVWDKILEQNMTLPDEIQEAVLSAVGQARLLMSQKLQQFASLLRRCEKPEPGQALVTRADLQGFWDMVFLQVENVDIRFNKLEQSRARGWVSEQPPPGAARAAKPPPKPPQPKPPARARQASSNRLKDIIAAARKAKQANMENTKTFDAGFFHVQSPVKSPGAATPLRNSPAAATPRSKPSLLQSVLSSEAKKASANKSSYAMLRASSLGKNVETENGTPYKANSIAPTPINLGLTPGKSILKSNINTSTKVPSKILSFKLLSSDTASDSSPTSDKGQISAVEKLRDLDTSSDSSPANLQNLDDSHDSQESVTPSKLQIQIQNFDNLQISESVPNPEDNSATTDTEQFEESKNRHSSRKTRKSLHNTDNLVVTNAEKLKEVKENRRSSRRTRETLPNAAEENLVTIITEERQEKKNRRSSRKKKENSPNAEENLMTTNTETLGEERQNRRLSRRTRKSSPNAEGNLLAANTENIHYNPSNLALRTPTPKSDRQDAMEDITPVMTRNRRKTRQTPVTENFENVQSSRRRKMLLEANEEKLDVTPLRPRSRRQV
ncbi:disks large-associated protein 5-like isoform X1 [Maniola jurtina]|uniref:disks large-associated protein 5-like isoform X1 n=1 Tax=Maniola jurtina TaxID=191418 RepID=UPI001E68F9A5|nr:disks large-associated protein 5-like isoform X1 [Maniola jurtina]